MQILDIKDKNTGCKGCIFWILRITILEIKDYTLDIKDAYSGYYVCIYWILRMNILDIKDEYTGY